MREDKILMSQKQLNRYNLLKLVLDGRISLKEATRGLGVSRTTWYTWKRRGFLPGNGMPGGA